MARLHSWTDYHVRRCRCASCVAGARAYLRERRKWRALAGQCADCPRPAEPERVRCAACREKFNAWARARYREAA